MTKNLDKANKTENHWYEDRDCFNDRKAKRDFKRCRGNKVVVDLASNDLPDDLPDDYEVCGTCGFDHNYDFCDSVAYAKMKHAHSFDLE